MESIFNFGVRNNMPDYLAKKVSLSNRLAILITAFGAAPFWLASLAYFPQISYLPLLSGILCLMVLPINLLGLTNLGRLIIALIPFALTTIYSAFLTPSGEAPLSSAFVIQFSFGVIGPFLMYDIRERAWLIVTGSIVFITVVFLNHTLNQVFEVEINNEVIKTGFLFNIAVAFSLTSTAGGILYLSYINFKARMTSQSLIEEMDKNNETLQKSQAEMKESIKQIRKNQIEEQKRNWASEGLSQFGALLRNNHESEVLFDELISGVTQYIKANQGGLYLVDQQDDGEVNIILKSCYAYARKKFTEYTTKPGQGLLGQAYYEKDIIYLLDIPEDYVKITSGLGEALPTAVLIVPLMVNDEVEAFFEFASFKEFQQNQIDFLKDLGETIGSFIRNSRINEQTKHLLEETQLQAEQMKEQEEEMLQNLEELQATQEEISRKEKEYIKKIAELEGILKEADIQLPTDSPIQNTSYFV